MRRELERYLSFPRAMRRAARRCLSAELGRGTAREVVARADEAYPAVAARIPEAGAGARHLLHTGAYAVALRQSLVEHGVEPEDASALISDIVFASIVRARSFLQRLGRLRHRDPTRAARWSARLARRLYYTEPDWEMHDVAVEGGFGMDVTRCVVAEFFESLEMSELCQRAICDQDIRSATHHGLVLERTGTLAAGADRCDFRYRTRPGRAESMHVLRDSVDIDASPDDVWSWLAGLADHYAEWHPDHVSAEWTLGEPNRVGSRLTAVECLDGHREELDFEMVDVDPPRRMEYRIRGPHSILLPGGSFEVTDRDGGSIFTATIRYRSGRLVEAAFRRRMAALRTHMREEGENLKRLVEAEVETRVGSAEDGHARLARQGTGGEDGRSRQGPVGARPSA